MCVQWLLKCYFTSTETVGLLGTGAQDVHRNFHTAPELCVQCCHDCFDSQAMVTYIFQVFLTSRAVYVIVFNLCDDLVPVFSESSKVNMHCTFFLLNVKKKNQKKSSDNPGSFVGKHSF